MALYGGLTQDGKDTTADLYILYLTKAGKEAWAKVRADPKQKSRYSRKEAACGSSGDQVIIWWCQHVSIPTNSRVQCQDDEVDGQICHIKVGPFLLDDTPLHE